MAERLIIRTQFSADGYGHADLNCDISDPETGRPMVLSDRAVDDAVFSMNELTSPDDFFRLQEFRRRRAQAIDAHFARCAQMMIEKIEAGEEWGRFTPDSRSKTDATG